MSYVEKSSTIRISGDRTAPWACSATISSSPPPVRAGRAGTRGARREHALSCATTCSTTRCSLPWRRTMRRRPNTDASRVPVILAEDLYANSVFHPVNEGVGFGLLRVPGSGERPSSRGHRHPAHPAQRPVDIRRRHQPGAADAAVARQPARHPERRAQCPHRQRAGRCDHQRTDRQVCPLRGEPPPDPDDPNNTGHHQQGPACHLHDPEGHGGGGRRTPRRPAGPPRRRPRAAT